MKTLEEEKVAGLTTAKTTTETIIDVVELKKSFGEQSVLKNVSLKLHQGENLVVLGKSGSGKSVLIKCIVRLLRSDEGTIDLLGNNVNKLNRTGLDELRKKVGFLFQSGALYDSMTVRQNLEFPLRRMKEKLTETEINKKVINALDHVGLADALNKMPSQLSGGMRKRISLARTIVVDDR